MRLKDNDVPDVDSNLSSLNSQLCYHAIEQPSQVLSLSRVDINLSSPGVGMVPDVTEKEK